jgi:putative endonuclease
MAFWVYILRCADGKYYAGHTDDLDRRIGQHMTGGYCEFTSKRLPVTLVWSENFGTRVEALEAEFRIKSWSRAKKEGLIRGDWAQVSLFAIPPSERQSRLERASPSTALGTNGACESITPSPFIPSEVEGSSPTKPFVSSEVETPAAQ